VLQEIRRGLIEVVSAAVLPLFTGPELQEMLCGAEDFDVAMLERNTELEPGVVASDEHVQKLWAVLRGMTARERSSFLRFVWARARLPASEELFRQKFKLQSLEPVPPAAGWSQAEQQKACDAMLPKSSTCFGALYLPKYSTCQIMRDRLVYAAANCISMDADFVTGHDESANWY
jgi:hypothetical protein